MKTILFILGLVALYHAGYSQRNLFSQSIDLCMPQGDLKEVANVGWGGTVAYERALTEKFRATATAAAMFFSKKTVTAPTVPPTSVEFKSTMWVTQAGVKYYLSLHPSRKLFVFGESGIHVLAGKIEVNGNDATPPNETHFSYATGAGYAFGRFELSYKQQWIRVDDGTFRYGDVRFSWFPTFRKKKEMK